MSTLIWRGSAAMTATPKSQGLKYAERITYNQEFEGPWATAISMANLHYRGSTWTIVLDTLGSANFVVDDCTLTRDRGDKGIVNINYTYLGVAPPDEFSLSPFEDNPPVERNTFFSTLTQQDLQLAKQCYEAATAAGQTQVAAFASSLPHSTLIQNLINKWLMGQETYYLASQKFQHTLHNYSGFTVSLGGFRQTPFGAFAANVPAGLSWLRQADELSWNNGIWRLTRTWLGSPGTPGWDSDLYP